MPIPSSINDLSTTAGSNSPAGSESPSLIDDYLRTYASYIALLRDGAQVKATSPIGTASNVKMSVAAAAASATLTADEIIVGTALGGSTYILSSFSKTINLATTGAGGMDTGTAPVTGYVALYAIYNPTTSTSALLATNAASLAPTVYGGANMPSGYTASALLAVIPTNASSQFVACLLVGRILSVAYRPMINNPAAAFASANVSAALPANAKRVRLLMSMLSSTANSVMTFIIAPANSTVGQANFSGTPNVAGNGWSTHADIDIGTAQTIWWSGTNTLGTPSFTAGAIGYEI